MRNTNTDVRIARVTVDDGGDWVLTVSGTDICARLWHNDEVAGRAFPGNSMGHRLIEHGWMPDRRAMYGPLTHSTVEARMLSMMAGWRPDGDASWTIPCFPT